MSGEEVVLGVDTHKDVHVAAVITALGALLATSSFPTTAAGYRQLLRLGPRFGAAAPGRCGVHRLLRSRAGPPPAAKPIEVIEVNQPDKATRRRRGKTDTVDAEAAARAVLSGRATATAKTGDGPVEMLRMLQAGQGLGDQVPHSGDQPAQGRTRRRRSRPARVACPA